MKKLDKRVKRLVVFSGFLNLFVLAVNLLSDFLFSNWICGVSFGIYFSFLLDLFGFFSVKNLSSDQEVPGNG